MTDLTRALLLLLFRSFVLLLLLLRSLLLWRSSSSSSLYSSLRRESRSLCRLGERERVRERERWLLFLSLSLSSLRRSLLARFFSFLRLRSSSEESVESVEGERARLCLLELFLRLGDNDLEGSLGDGGQTSTVMASRCARRLSNQSALPIPPGGLLPPRPYPPRPGYIFVGGWRGWAR